MKRYKSFFSLCLVFVYSIITMSPCFAISKLYYLENTSKSRAGNHIETVLADKEYTIVKKDPYLSTSKKDEEEYNIIVLQPNGNNLYYYFESNTKSKKVNKAILKTFKRNDIEYNELEEEAVLANFSQIAQRVRTGEKKSYSFEEPKIENKTIKEPAVVKEKPSTTMKGFIGNVGKGDNLDAYLQNPINTATANVNDNITAVLNSDWRTKNNLLIAPKGSIITGRLTEAEHARRGLRNGKVTISFDTLLTPDGKTYNITTKPIDFNVTNEGKAQQIIADFATSALIGAGVGLLMGLFTDDPSNMLKGAAIGAGVGGLTSAVPNVVDTGIDAEIPAYTSVQITLKKDINVVLSY